MADAMDLMNCSICLDLLKYPVAIPCGHNYCMGCIEDCWNQGDLNGVYSCPDCRKTFTLRPVLNKNTLLIELVEKLKNTRLHAASASHCYAEPGDVECDFCIGRKLKSVKFCLVCLASYCETHLQPHYEVAPLKKHKLVKASTQLHEMICSHHDKLLEVYCRTDQQCICYLCTVDEHKGHDTVSAAAERTEKQKQLDEKQQILKQRIQKTEMGVLGARQSIQFIKSSAQAAVEDSERIFPELIRSIERRSSEVKQLIKAKEMAEVSRTEGHLKQLEEEVVELRRKDAELEQLSHTEDHIHFLKSFQSFSVPPGIEGLLSTFNPHVSIEDVKKSLSELQDRMENVFNEEMVKISRKAPSHAEADSEVEVVYVRQPTVEQALLAKELLLPLTFFCYQNEPGYTSDDQTDDEDFETAVKALNGILYQDPPEREAASAGSAGQAEAGVEGLDPEVEVLWEKRPTPEEEQKARNLQLPSTFFCGVGSDSEAEKDKPEDFETEFRKAQEALDAERSSDPVSSEDVSSSTCDTVPELQVPDKYPSSQEQASDQSGAEVQSSTAEEYVPDQSLTIQEAEIPTPGSQEQATEQSVTIQDADIQSSTAEEQVPVQSVTIQEADVQSSIAEEQVPVQSVTIQEAEVQSTTEEQQTPDQSDSTSTPSQTAVSRSREQATTPNPSEKPAASPPALVTPSFGFGFGAQFGKKPGQWECDMCLVRNEESASSCVSCQTLNPAASSGEQAPDQSDSTPAAISSSPIDLSAKKTSEPDSNTTFTTTTTRDALNSFGSLGFSALGGEGFSFADLAHNTGGEFAFGKQDSNFSWANAGATLFGAADPAKAEGGEEECDEGDTNNVGIDFEPIVSLPEVETKSGEEDEEILFKERTKLYRWERDLGQWKERGVGDIKILFHPDKRFYRVLMRREQVLKVCANHTICQSMELKPMNTSNQALVWTATDFSEGEGKVEQLAAKFKTAELAESFRKTFCECQRQMSQSEASTLSSPQLSRVQEHSRDTNPQVYLSISADDEPLGTVTIELFSHIVPKTAENFRALCTGQKGFGLRNTVFHRVVPDFMCQGGDITNQDGTGGKSIYGHKFEDENFDVRHTGPGLLSMANHGRDTNNSQFFITLKKAEHLDFKHVAFGFVREGMDVVRSMGELGTKTGKPSKKIVITECGQL